MSIKTNKGKQLELAGWVIRGITDEYPDKSVLVGAKTILREHVKQRQAQQQQAAQKANESLIQKLKRFIQYIKDFE